MSYTETKVGKLKLIDEFQSSKELEEKCKKLANQAELEFTPNDSWERLIRYDTDKYLIRGNCIYEVIIEHSSESEGIYYMEEKEPGLYSFVMQYYNGGTCLMECLDEELEKIKNPKKPISKK